MVERSKQLHDHHREPTNLRNWGKRSLKKVQGFNGIRTHDLHEYRCDALLIELYEATDWEPCHFCGFYLSHEGNR